MSNTVDEQILKMRFDNEGFESNIKTTLRSLASLSDSLNFDGASKGLTALGTTLGKASSSIGSVTDGVAGVVQTLGEVTVSAGTWIKKNVVDDLYKQAKKILTSNIVSSAINQMKTGGMARAENLENAKFQLEGLKVAWDDVEPYISKAVDGTAYGLDAAAKVASQLVASEVALGDDMQNALSGISGVAAMTNSSYEDIGHIFTTIAGQGKVMTEQLNQFAGRGLNVAAELAKAYGVDEATLRDMVTKGQVDFKTFSKAMNEAFGEQATKANETYSGSLSNVKAALSRIGAEFATPYRNNMRDLFNTIRPKINKLKELLMPFIDDFNKAEEAFFKFVIKIIDNIDLTPLSKIVDIARGIVDLLGKIGAKTFDIFNNTFPNGFFSKFGTLSDMLSNNEYLFGKVSTKVEQAFDSFKKFLTPVKEAVEPLKEVNETVDQLANRVLAGEFGNGEERRKALEDLGASYEMVENRVNELLGCTYRYEVSAEEITKMNGTVAEANEETAKSFSIVDKIVSAAEPIMTGLANALSLVVDTVVALAVGLSPAVSVLQSFGMLILNMTTRLARYFTLLRNVTTETGFFNKAAAVLTKIFSGFAAVANPAIKWLDSMLLSMTLFLNKLTLLIFNYDKYKKENDALSAAVGLALTIFNKLKDAVVGVATWIGTLIDRIKSTPAFQRLVDTVKALMSALKALGLDLFLAAVDAIQKKIEKIKMPEIDQNKVVFKITEILTKFRTTLEGVIEKVNSLREAFKAGGFKGFIGELFNLDNASEQTKGTIEKLQTVFGPFVTWCQRVGNEVNKFIAVFQRDPALAIKVWLNKIRLAFKEKFESILNFFDPVIRGIRGFFSSIIDILEKTGILPALRRVFEPITNDIEKFITVFKQNPSLAIKMWLEKMKSTFDTVGKDLKEKVTNIFTKIREAVTQFVADFKEDPATAFKNLFERIRQAVSEFKTSDIVAAIKEKFKSIFKLATKGVSADASGSFDFMETVTDIITSIRENFVDGLKGINLQSISNVVSAFPGWFKALATGLLAFNVSRIAGNVSKVPKEFAKLISSFTKDFIPELTKIPAAITTGINDFFGISTAIKGFITGLSDTITKLGDGLTETMKSYRKHLAIKNILYIAASVALITVSIIALAQFPIEQIAAAGIVVAGVMFMLRVICDGMSDIDAKPIIGLGVVIAALTGVMVALALVQWDTLLITLGKFGIAAVAVITAVHFLSEYTKGNSLDAGFGIAIVGMAAGLLLMATAFDKLYKTIGSKDGIIANLGAFAGALIAIAGFIAGIIVVTKMTNGADLNMTATSLIAFGVAINLMAIAFNNLMGHMNSVGQWLGAVTALGVLVGAFAAIAAVTNATDLSITAGALVAYAIALQVLMGVFTTASFFSPETIFKGLIIMTGVAGVLALLGLAMQQLVPPLATLLVVLTALGGLVLIVAKNWDIFKDGFSKMWSDLTADDGLITKIVGWFSSLGDKIRGVKDSLQAKIQNSPVVKFFSSISPTLKNAKGSVINIGDAFSGLASKFKTWASNFAPVKAAFEFLGGIKDKIGGALGGVGDFISNLLGGGNGEGGPLSLLTSFGEKLSGIKDTLYSTFVEGTFLGDIVGKVSGFTSAITDKIGGLFSGLTEGGAAGLQNLIKGFTEDPLGAVSGAIDNLKKIWLGDGEGDTGVWGMVKNFFEPGVTAVKNLLGGFADNIANFFKDPLGTLKTWWLGDSEAGTTGVWGMISGFFSAGAGALGKIKDGFVEGITTFFSDPLGTLKTWWLGDSEAGTTGVWGVISGFFDAGAGALKNIVDGFVEGITTFFSDPLGTLKTWWLGDEDTGTGGVWGMISGFFDAGAGALGNVKNGFIDGVATFFKDPLDSLKSWWLGDEDTGTGGVWGIVSGFFSAGGSALKNIVDGFVEGIQGFFKDPIENLKSWWLGDEDTGTGGVWGMISDFTKPGLDALSNLVSAWENDPNSLVGKAITSVKSLFFGKTGQGGIFGWAKSAREAGQGMLSKIAESWNNDPGSFVTNAIGSIKELFFGSSDNGGVFSWVSKVKEAGESMLSNIAESWQDDPGSIVTNAFKSIGNIFFGENNEGGVFAWAGDMLTAGKDMLTNIKNGISDSGLFSKFSTAVDDIGSVLLYGDGDARNPGSFSLMGAFGAITEKAGGLLSAITENFNDPSKRSALATAAQGIGSALSNAFSGVGSFFQKGLDFFDHLINGFSEESVSTVGSDGFGGGGRKFDTAINNMVTAVGAFSDEFGACGSDFFAAVCEAFNGDTDTANLALATVGSATMKLVHKIQEHTSSFKTEGSMLLKAVGEGFGDENAAAIVKEDVGIAISKNFRKVITDWETVLETSGKNLAVKVKDGFVSFSDRMASFVGQVIFSQVNKIRTYYDKFTAVGKQLIDGLKSGFTNAKDDTVKAADDIVLSAHLRIRDYLELYNRDGSNLITCLKDGFLEIASQFVQAVKNVMFSGVSAHYDYLDKYSAIGSNLASSMGSGVGSITAFNAFVGAVYNLMEYGYKAANGYSSAFFVAGQNIVTGLANGVYYNAYTAINAIQSVAYNMLNRMCSILDINSPSGEGEKIGQYFDEGIAKGLNNRLPYMTRTVETVGHSALLTMGKAVAEMSALAEDSMNTSPVIRPIMDMTDIVEGFNTVGMMASQQDFRLGLAAAGIFQSDVLSTVHTNQNGLAETIETLRSDIARLGDTVDGLMDGEMTLQAIIPVDLDGEEISKRTADVAIRRINHIQANKQRVAGR